MNKFLPLAVLLVFVAGCQVAPKPAAPNPTVTATGTATADPFWPKDGILPGKGKTSNWAGFRAKNVERRTLFAARQVQDQGALVFVGDSITEGWKTLEQDFAGLGIKVANRGIGGDTTPNLLYRLQDDILSLHPRALVILIGTNDVGSGNSAADIADNLRQLLQRIRAAYPAIPVAWCLVMPRGTPAFLPPIQDLNDRLAKLASEDPKVTLCDTYHALALPDGTPNPALFVPDLLHLNPAGYAAWREAVYPLLAGWGLGSSSTN